jgi:hypothetical protein
MEDKGMAGYTDYQMGKKIELILIKNGINIDDDFYSIIQCLMRYADNVNLLKLTLAWPKEWDDLYARYHSPGGLLDGEIES